jgi:hypothetical protein
MMRMGRKTRIIMIVVAALALTALVVVPAIAATGKAGGGWGRMMGRNSGNAATGVCPGAGLGGGQAVEAVTALLGMTRDEIISELKAGKSLTQIAESKGVSKDKLVSTIVDARKAVLQQAVTDGRLTQEQMDLMVQRMTERVSALADSTSLGTYSGRGGMMGRGGNAPYGGCPGAGNPGTGARATTSSQI